MPWKARAGPTERKCIPLSKNATGTVATYEATARLIDSLGIEFVTISVRESGHVQVHVSTQADVDLLADALELPPKGETYGNKRHQNYARGCHFSGPYVFGPAASNERAS